MDVYTYSYKHKYFIWVNVVVFYTINTQKGVGVPRHIRTSADFTNIAKRNNIYIDTKNSLIYRIFLTCAIIFDMYIRRFPFLFFFLNVLILSFTNYEILY